MVLFGRNKSDNNEVPEDLQQYYSTGGSGVMKWVIRGIAGVVVLALLIWGGVALAHKLSHKTTPTTAQSNSSQQTKAQQQAQADEKKAQQETQQQQTANGSSSSSSNSNNGSSNSSSNSSSSTQTPQSPSASTQTQPQTATNDSNLPNTGPGQTIGIFVGVSALAAVAHAIVTRYKRQLR